MKPSRSATTFALLASMVLAGLGTTEAQDLQECPLKDNQACSLYESVLGPIPEGCKSLNESECRRAVLAPIPPQCRSHFENCVTFLWETCIDEEAGHVRDECFDLFEDIVNYYRSWVWVMPPPDCCTGRYSIDGSTAVLREPVNYRIYPYVVDHHAKNFGEFYLIQQVAGGYEYAFNGISGVCGP